MVAGDPDHGMHFVLTGGAVNDIKIGKQIIENYSFPKTVDHLVMDKGYSCYEIVKLCKEKALIPVVPPKANFEKPWMYNRNVYVYRNEIERLFHRMKNFRRISTRYDKLDLIYASFIFLGLVTLLLKVLC